MVLQKNYFFKHLIFLSFPSYLPLGKKHVICLLQSFVKIGPIALEKLKCEQVATTMMADKP